MYTLLRIRFSTLFERVGCTWQELRTHTYVQTYTHIREIEQAKAELLRYEPKKLSDWNELRLGTTHAY